MITTFFLWIVSVSSFSQSTSKTGIAKYFNYGKNTSSSISKPTSTIPNFTLYNPSTSSSGKTNSTSYSSRSITSSQASDMSIYGGVGNSTTNGYSSASVVSGTTLSNNVISPFASSSNVNWGIIVSPVSSLPTIVSKTAKPKLP